MMRLLTLLLLAGCSTAARPVVDVIVVEGCPGRQDTIDLVESVAHELGIAIQLQQTLVDTPEEAVRTRLLGSPTVLVNGFDIELVARNRTDFTISCRIYSGTPVPSRAMVVRALTEAVGKR
jgi:hypothetical protein